MPILIIVESRTKANKFQKLFDKSEYIVKASNGHIKRLKDKNNGVSLTDNFKPIYEIIPEKRGTVKELVDASKIASEVIIATDPDREGERIGESICEVLKLDPKTTKRITYTDTTKSSLLKALKNPHKLNEGMLNSQKCRSVLDYLVGFQISPVLWHSIQSGLSAGRVQSVATKLIIDRDQHCKDFTSKNQYNITADFYHPKLKITFQATLQNKLPDEEKTKDMLVKSQTSEFTIRSRDQKIVNRKPQPPFETSTLQQEASKKLHMSSKETMSVAQTLFQDAKITYHRTDSTHLSTEFLENAKAFITKKYTEAYHKTRQYETTDDNAQEAHEAIRCVDCNVETLDPSSSTPRERALYNLIWKRSIASQMKSQEVRVITYIISISKYPTQDFKTIYEEELFKGFKILYQPAKPKPPVSKSDMTSTPETTMTTTLQAKIVSMKKGDKVDYKELQAEEQITQSKGRYTNAQLIGDLKKKGIGRPSTYASIITTIQDRKYIEIKSIKGETVKTKILTTTPKIQPTINTATKDTTLNEEKNKFFPTETGLKVTEFLNGNFKSIMKYKYTALVESKLDIIAQNKIDWQSVVKSFYKDFSPQVQMILKEPPKAPTKASNARQLGIDPKTEQPVFATVTKFGSAIRLGTTKAKFVSLPPTLHIDKVTLEEALSLLTAYPRTVTTYKDKPIEIKKGKYGVYLTHNGTNISLPEGTKEDAITSEFAISCVEKKTKQQKNVIKEFASANIRIMTGPYGYYILQKGKSPVSLKNVEDPSKLTLEETKKLLKVLGKPKPKYKPKK